MSEHVEIADRPDTGWRSLTLGNSWTGSAQYRSFDGRTYLRGKVTAGTTTNGTTIFTLPADARLATAITYPVSPDGADTDSSTPPARLKIGSDGTAKVYAAGSIQDISLAGISWFVGQ